jgi:hypothetical protein
LIRKGYRVRSPRYYTFALGTFAMGSLALIIKKYFKEHNAYFNFNCKEVYRFEWEFGERRETVRAFIVNCLTDMTVNIVEVVLVQNTVVHVNSGNENDHLGNRPKRPHFIQNTNYLPKRPLFFGQNGTFNNYRLMHVLIHIRTVIIPRDRYRPEGFSPRADIGRGMITVLLWKTACINPFIAYFNIEITTTKLTSHIDTKLIWIWVIDIGWGIDNSPTMEKVMHWSIYRKAWYRVIRFLSRYLPMGWYRCVTSGVYV